MEIRFYKYQGTGNDFVMIDDRAERFPNENLELIMHLCNRRFGIGADGLILIRNREGYDFEMIYFNGDGTQSMCGNGARCAVAFAGFLGIIQNKTSFYAIDGPHKAQSENGLIELEMSPVGSLSNGDEGYFVDTGSPHYVRFVEDLDSYPVVEAGSKIRYSEPYQPNGTNVNFVKKISDTGIQVRTYERGVEDETLSCGTGVTACALVFGQLEELNIVKIKTLGGDLSVKFEKTSDGGYQNIKLIGPARQVYSGSIQLDLEEHKLKGD